MLACRRDAARTCVGARTSGRFEVRRAFRPSRRQEPQVPQHAAIRPCGVFFEVWRRRRGTKDDLASRRNVSRRFGSAMARLFSVVLRGLLLTLPTSWATADEPSAWVRQEGSWCVCETDHFSVWGSPAAGNVQQSAKLCESLRESLHETWCAGSSAEQWTSKCVVVLHAKAADYAVAVSQPGTRSVGCTTLQVDQGRVTFRRIDIRCDRSNWSSSALPHELTHVILADRLSGEPLPLWADEGLAVLAESASTQKAREAVLVGAVRQNRTFSVTDLLRQEVLPRPEKRDVFYSQSTALVGLLIERAKPAGFLAYLERARLVGNDAALRECYGVDGVAGLEDLWRERADAVLTGVPANQTAIAARGAKASAKN